MGQHFRKSYIVIPGILFIVKHLIKRFTVSKTQILSDDDLLALHLRNAKQNKHLPTSQKAIESLEELKGIKSKEEQQSNGNVTVNIVGVFKDD